MLNIQHDHGKIDVKLHRDDKYIWRIKHVWNTEQNQPQSEADTDVGWPCQTVWGDRGWDKGWLGTISGDRCHTLAFPAAEKTEVKGLKEQQKELSDTSSEKLVTQTIPIIHRLLQAQTPHQSMLCAPESWGHKERDRAAQVRGGMAQCLIWSCVHNHYLRLITLLFAVQKSFFPVLQEAQHWFLPFFHYRELVKPPLCQESQAEFTHCKLPVPHRT